MTLTATRVGPAEVAPHTRTLFRLSEPAVSEDHPGPFQYIVLSLGRDGDTCVFPSDARGGILGWCGFGFGLGPSRWLAGEELDDYVTACIAQHEADGGTGLHIYHEETE